MRIDSSGNLLVGTTSNPDSSRMVVSGGSITHVSTQLNTRPGAGVNYELVNRNGAGFDFFVNNASNFAARLDGLGNLLLGTTAPSGRLTVVGNSTEMFTFTAASAGSGYGVLRNSSGTTYAILGNGGGGALSGGAVTDFAIRAENNMLFAIGNTERARITSGGNLLVNIGTVVQGGRFGVADTSNAVCIGLYAAGTGNTTGTYLNCGDDNNINFRVFTNGNVQNANNSYGAISDIKVKDNVEDATPKLHDLMQVRVVNYNLKTQPDQKHIGVVAQELEEIFPGLVEEAADRDAEGELTGETTKSVKYSVFVPMLIKALQEANEKIDTLAARVAQLEGN
jgi:hypothetical protein